MRRFGNQTYICTRAKLTNDWIVLMWISLLPSTILIYTIQNEYYSEQHYDDGNALFVGQ